MRELKGDWKDLFNGFTVALDLRKMFLGLCGVVFTMGLAAATVALAHSINKEAIHTPQNLAPGEIWQTLMDSFHVIFNIGPKGLPGPDPLVYIPFGIGFVLIFIAIWSFFGGAICRIAAYEIARDGERMEIQKALRFSSKKFWAFLWAPLLCVLGFAFFYIVTALGGLIGGLVDGLFGWLAGFHVASPLVALFLPLALLAGFIMALILVGAVTSSFLFAPAVAAEGTDSFDAVSRGFSYVYAKPWHTLWYQGVSAVYGYICVLFVIYFASVMCLLALEAGNLGYKVVDKQGTDFRNITYSSWDAVLSESHSTDRYKWSPRAVVTKPHPYGRYMTLMNQWTGLNQWSRADLTPLERKRLGQFDHKLAYWITTSWLLVTLGMAFSYLLSYFFSSQTLIYFLLRKKMDGIEMNEVFDDTEEETAGPGPATSPAPSEQKPESAGEKK